MDKPNVTVIYQDAPRQPIGCLSLILELVLLVVFVLVFVAVYMIF